MPDKRVLAFALLNAFGTLADLGGGWFGYENGRWSECTNLYSTCKPTISTCADYLCAQCYSDGGAGFKSCCNQPTPYICFQTGAGGGGGNPQITAAPSIVTNPQQLACQAAGAIIQSCESATPNFDNLEDPDVASCLCYSGTNWQPQSFDQPWSSCITWASTADTSDYADWKSLNGFCSSVGDVMKSPATVVATTSPSSLNAVATGAGGDAGSPTTSADNSGLASKGGAGMLRPAEMVVKMLLIVAFSITLDIFIF